MTNLSTTENRILMHQARESLKGNWGPAIGAHVISLMISMIAGSVMSLMLSVPIMLFVMLCGLPEALTDMTIRFSPTGILTGPLTIGLSFFGLLLSRNENFDIMQVFHGFKNGRFLRGFLAWLLMYIFVCLWLLLLIIPGIIKCFSYSLTYYIMADDDSIAPLDAISKSKDLMYGNKGKMFCLGWRFFGWALLSICTCCIGFIWLIPYMNITMAKFYDDIKQDSTESNDSKEDLGELNEEQ